MKTFNTYFMISMLITSIYFTSCQTDAEKTKAAELKVDEAKEDLNNVKKNMNADKQSVILSEEWKIFKRESELAIEANDQRIIAYRQRMKDSGKTMDSYFEKRISALQEKNRDMRLKVAAYEKDQSNWEEFKREFDHDMDALGKSLEDLTIDNKN